jgi:NAD dependent epimerase/dehydratase family enzyme
MRIVIPGGSGQVGQLLARHFHSQGHDVTVLTRKPATAPWRTVAWDGITGGDWQDSLEGCDACINLAGRTVNCRYNPVNRAEMLNSRVDSTRILGKVIASLAHPTPGTFRSTWPAHGRQPSPRPRPRARVRWRCARQ